MREMIEWCGYKWESKMDGGRRIHPDQPWMWYCDKNATIDKSNVLHLKITEYPIDIQHWDGKTYSPTIATGIVRSVNPFRYGTFEAKIKLPKGFNLWPSFWLTGDKHWPPEIDILEAWSGENDYFKWFIAQPPYFCPSWRTTTNVHYNEIVDSEGSYIDGNYRKTSIGSRNIPWCKQKKDPTEEFIEYKCEWFPDSIKFYANGKLVRKVGKDVVEKLVKDLPDQSFQMDVIFNLWCEDPETCKVQMDTEMLVKDFTYKPYTS